MDQTQNSNTQQPEFLLDDTDLLTAEDQAALEAEQAVEPTLPAPQVERRQTPEAPQQADPQQQAQKKEPPKHIPYPRFKQAIDKANDLEKQLTQERERLARLDERMRVAREAEERIAAERSKQPPQEAPTKLGARPDVDIDPIGADLWDAKRKAELLEYRVEQLSAGVGQTNQQLQQNREQQDFANWLNSDVSSFRSQQADYDKVTAYAYNFRVNHWKGLGLPEEQARLIVDNETAAIANLARANGRSAAGHFYELGKQFGYQPENGNESAQGQQQAPAAVTPEVQPSLAKQRMEQVRKGQQFQGLSRVPAENSDNLDWSNLNGQAIADIPEEDFVAMMADPVKGAQLRKALQRLELGA